MCLLQNYKEIINFCFFKKISGGEGVLLLKGQKLAAWHKTTANKNTDFVYGVSQRSKEQEESRKGSKEIAIRGLIKQELSYVLTEKKIRSKNYLLNF